MCEGFLLSSEPPSADWRLMGKGQFYAISKKIYSLLVGASSRKLRSGKLRSKRTEAGYRSVLNILQYNKTKKGHLTIQRGSLFNYFRYNKIKSYYNKALTLKRIRPRPSTSRTFTSISSPSFTMSVTLATRSLASSEI